MILIQDQPTQYSEMAPELLVPTMLLPFMKMLVCAFSKYSSEYIDDKIEEAFVVRMMVMAACLLSFYLLV